MWWLQGIKEGKYRRYREYHCSPTNLAHITAYFQLFNDETNELVVLDLVELYDFVRESDSIIGVDLKGLNMICVTWGSTERILASCLSFNGIVREQPKDCVVIRKGGDDDEDTTREYIVGTDNKYIIFELRSIGLYCSHVTFAQYITDVLLQLSYGAIYYNDSYIYVRARSKPKSRDDEGHVVYIRYKIEDFKQFKIALSKCKVRGF